MSNKISSLFIALLITLTASQQVFCAGLTVFGPEDFETNEWHFKLARRTFSVDDPGDGIIKVTKTDPGNVPDGGFLIFNFRLIPLREFFYGDDLVFEKDVPLKSYNRMLISFRGTPGAPIQISVSNEGVQIPSPEVAVTADPETIVAGQITTLSWSSSWADSCVIEPDIGEVDTQGSLDVAPEETTTYAIVAESTEGMATDSVTVIVTPPAPAVSISVEPDTVASGGEAVLTWSSEHADSYIIEPGIGAVDLNGSMIITPSETTTYTITVTGAGGTRSANVLVTVINPPEITIIEPDGINDIADESFTITWTDEDPDSNASIALYYDTDNTGADGTLIAGGINEDPDDTDDQFVWDTSAMDQQDYYIYAVIDDGVNPAVTAYSTGPVTISHNAPPEITIDSVEEYISQGTYEYTDSRDPGGPVYNWIDITADGTEVELSRNDSVEVVLPFEFPFYGENKTSMRIGSNGYLTFGTDGDSSYNGPIPDAGTPNDIIAIHWEGLNPMYGGTIHYYYHPTENYFIVQYTNIYASSFPFLRTFQGILYPNGDILMQYKNIEGFSPGTVGVENADGTEGLQIAYNSSFIENELAVLINKASNKIVIQWIDEAPDSNALISIYYDIDNTGADGVLIAEGISEDPDGIDDQFTWDTSEVPEGTYYIYIVIDDGINEPVISYYGEPVAVDRHTPHLFSIPDQEVIEGEELSFTIQAIDPNDDPLTYSASNLPEGATFDPATQEFSWTPSAGQTGEFYPEFTVTDGEYSGTLTVKITVVPRPPLVGISAEPLIVVFGESSTLTWTSSDADTCTISPDIGDVPVNGSIDVTPQERTTYTITATGPGGTATDAVTVWIEPPSVSITADPTTIEYGESSTLSWTSDYADTCTISPDIGAVALNGSIDVFPQESTTYTITATGPGGTDTDSVFVQIEPPSVSITADPGTVEYGGSSTLSWTSNYADTCTITPDIGAVALNGSIDVTPEEETTYTITAIGPGGTATDSVSVSVTGPPQVSLSVSESVINYGDSVILTWNAVPAQRAYFNNGIGEVASSGSMTLTPEYTATYEITAVNNDQTTNHSISVKVLGHPPALQSEGTFGEQYNDLIPEDASLESYDPERFIILTGIVEDITGNPLPDVNVAVWDHPEYGSVLTDGTGQYSIPAEGGGLIRLSFEKQDYLIAHRKTEAPVTDIVVMDTVTLITQDPASTVIAFDGNPDTILTHKSTEVVDSEFGNRSCTMIFTGDNKAYELDKYGNQIQELTTITTRATEYTTPESMPAKLPPNSAFTYCTEMSVDGVERVKFDKPVTSYVDNFLGFDVGEIVPVGSYDRDQGVWIPEENGVVVELLDTNSDGVVDALDADGDGQADDLDGSGSFGDEVTGLDDPLSYPPGNTYWRFQATHFTPWDCNWPYGPIMGAIPPNPESLPTCDQQLDETENCNTPSGSHVEDRSRILHEDISIAGTDMTLHYSSARSQGAYKRVIDVPVSGESVPASLKRILVRVIIAGRTMKETVDALPNQKVNFVWDGLDHRGKIIERTIDARISIGFVYDSVYYSSPSDFAKAFAMTGGSPTNLLSREEIVFWKHHNIPVDANLRKATSDSILEGIAEGWTISARHYLNPGNLSTLFKGDGSKIRNNVKIINTVAGNGNKTNQLTGGSGNPATEIPLNSPGSLAIDAQGNFYFVDSFVSRIWKVDTSGIIHHVVGGAGFDGDGGLAYYGANVDHPTDIEFDSHGNLYIADTDNHRIRKIDTNGFITTVAGSGEISGFSGDGGPATEAKLRYPSGITIDSYGNIYVADRGNQRIRKVDPNGIITTVAGNGEAGYSGDGGSAMEASFDTPMGIEIDAQGNLYIADHSNSCIRKVAINGIITTVAGTGENNYSGDGGLATEAELFWPIGLEIDAQGNLYVADTYNQRIRMINKNGIITTIAGCCYTFGHYSGDGGPPTEARFDHPRDLVIDPKGGIYISDAYNYRVRKIGAPSVFAETLANGEIPFADANGLGYIMDSTGLHQKTIDLDRGNTLYFFGYGTFDGQEQLITITDQFGNQIFINRHSDGTPYSITSPDGLVTQLDIDVDNHLTSITCPDNSSYNFEYTTDGLLTDKTEPNGNHFEYYYNGNGRITDTYDENGGHWQFDRPAGIDGTIHNSVTTGEKNVTTYQDYTYSTGKYTSLITGPAGDEASFTRSADGLSVQKNLPCGMALEFTYDVDPEYNFKVVKQMTETTSSGLTKTTGKNTSYNDTDADEVTDLIIRAITINNKTTTFENNILTAQKTTTSPEGRTVTRNYDPTNLLTDSISIPDLFDTNYGYDNRGRVTSILTNTRETLFTYDDQGNVETVTDPEGYTTTYGYDAVGRVTAIDRPDTSDLSFSYDNNGNMTVLTNPSDISHGFGFNSVSLMDSYQTPLSGNYSYLYDKDRRLIAKTFPSGKEILHTYDTTQLAQTQAPEGTIDYTYLCGNKISSITKGTESIAYDYDGKLFTDETLSGTMNQTLSYTYNNDFNLDTFTSAGDTKSYAYDDDGLMIGAGNFTIARNAQNGLPETVSGGTLVMDHTFTGYGEIGDQDVAVNGLVLSSWALTRDNNGRIADKTETVDGVTSTYVYEYDTMGRLISVTKDGTLVEEYAYNLNGSRDYEMNSLRGIAGRTMGYSDEDHLLTADSANYQYDLDGFLITKTEGADITSYTYSSRGELLSVILPDSTIIEYVHDPLGRRIAKKVDGAITEKYLWQGRTRLLAIYDGSDNLQQRFEYAGGRMPVAITQGGATYYPTYDQVGSLRAVADASGTVVKRIEYDSFGNITNDTNPSFAVPFGFAGGLQDPDTGLVRFGYRDYDPDIGRWTAKDPIGFAGGDTDLYGYVLNDPVNFVDPTGEFINLGAAGVGAAIGAGVGIANAIFSRGDVIQGALTGAAVGSLAGLSFGTSLIANSLIGASIGAMTDIASQHFSNPCAAINSTSVFISTLSGAIGGGASTAMIRGGATIADAALFSGAISGGASTGMHASVNY